MTTGGRSFPARTDAARHERTLTHWMESPAIAPAGPTARAALGELYDAAGRARLGATTYASPPEHHLVIESGGTRERRRVGICEGSVDHVHEVVWPYGSALPSRLYVAAAYLLSDLEWLASVARERPDVDV